MGRTDCTETQRLYKGDLYLYLLFNFVTFGTEQEHRVRVGPLILEYGLPPREHNLFSEVVISLA